jgi:hypothetical protein
VRLAWLVHRTGSRSTAYLVFGLVFAFFGLVDQEYGLTWFYSILAVICLLQFIVPTPVGWGAVFVLFAVATTAMLFAVARDIVRLVVGGSPTVLLDLDDSCYVILFTVVLLGITTWLFRTRPRRLTA